MKTVLCCILILLCGHAKAQEPLSVLNVSNDTLFYQFGDQDKEAAVFSKLDKVNRFNAPFIHDGKTSYWTFSTKNQSVKVTHQGGKQPFSKLAVSDGRTTKWLDIRFFEPVSAQFSPSYQQQFRGTANFEIPEVYELANVVLALTETGKNDYNMIQHKGDYYQRVMKHFGKFENHPLVLRLDSLISEDYNAYYAVRENAYAFSFREKKGNRLTNPGIYGVLWQGINDMAHHTDQWEDFSRKSRFRKFFADNSSFYEKDVSEVKRLLPVQSMQKWLENEFPARYDCMRVIFSPLIAGSHSAQQLENQGFRESLMFVCNAYFFENMPYSDSQRSAFYSGIVFTEIDHNYVNPVSDLHAKDINRIFGQRAVWVAPGKADWYSGGYEVFNEYMTHAVHLLYIKEKYTPEIYEMVRQQRTDLNVSRGFYRFNSFLTRLHEIYEARKPGQTIADLYPEIIRWGGGLK